MLLLDLRAAPRELEQAADERTHLLRLAVEIVEQRAALLGVELDVAAQDVDVRLQARQRRTQLVRRVGDEAPLRLERLLERREHRVERGAQGGELVVPALRNALARLAGLGDSLGGRGQPPHGGERRARDDGAADGGGGDRAERDEDEDEPQPFERPVLSCRLRTTITASSTSPSMLSAAGATYSRRWKPLTVMSR